MCTQSYSIRKVTYHVPEPEEKESAEFFRYSRILDVERALDGLPKATIEDHLRYVTEELALSFRDVEKYALQQ